MQSIVYGPVNSRRFGLSLGLNLLGPKKICSFDCPYCDLGPSVVRMNQIKRNEIVLPSATDVLSALALFLRSQKDPSLTIETLLISGNGEPTVHPDFAAIVEGLPQIKKEFELKAKTMILTNAAHLESKRTVAAINQLDERLVKLDAGNDRMLKLINKPLVRTNVTKVYANFRKLTDVIVQSFFVSGSIDNTKSEDIDEWIEIIGIIQPKLVQICSINRTPVDPGIKKADEDTLYTIASKLKRRTQIESAVFL